MKTSNLQLPQKEMINAMLNSDPAYEGIFFTAVKTTKIFCRPTCPARKPKPENVEFFADAQNALAAGYRPCKRCKPLAMPGEMPEWINTLLKEVAASPYIKWDDQKIVGLGVDPVRLRRWFKQHMGMTFHNYLRTKHLGEALGQIKDGDTIDGAAYSCGYESVSGFREAFQNTFGTSAGKAENIQTALFNRINTPLGPMLAVIHKEKLLLLEFIDRPALIDELKELKDKYYYHLIPGESPVFTQLASELTEYFAGQRTEFTIPLIILGTDFQKAIWASLLQIDCGQTLTYGQLAASVGNKNAARPAGTACGKNRIAILIPCHRIIGEDGSLTGYGGGKARKQYLLDLERKELLHQKTLL